MFGIGGAEFALILLFGFLIFGPDKMPQIARTVGKAIRQFKGAQEKMNTVIKTEVYDPLNDAASDMNPFKDFDDGMSGKKEPSSSTSHSTASKASGVATAATAAAATTAAEKKIQDNNEAASAADAKGVTFEQAAKSVSEGATGPAKKSGPAKKAAVADGTSARASGTDASQPGAVKKETFVERKTAADAKKASKASAIYGVSAKKAPAKPGAAKTAKPAVKPTTAAKPASKPSVSPGAPDKPTGEQNASSSIPGKGGEE